MLNAYSISNDDFEYHFIYRNSYNYKHGQSYNIDLWKKFLNSTLEENLCSMES